MSIKKSIKGRLSVKRVKQGALLALTSILEQLLLEKLQPPEPPLEDH